MVAWVTTLNSRVNYSVGSTFLNWWWLYAADFLYMAMGGTCTWKHMCFVFKTCWFCLCCSLTQMMLPTSGLAWNCKRSNNHFQTHHRNWIPFCVNGVLCRWNNSDIICTSGATFIQFDQPQHQNVSRENLPRPLLLWFPFSPRVSVPRQPYFVFPAPISGVIPVSFRYTLFFLSFLACHFITLPFLANLLSGFNNTSVPGYDISPDHTSHICIQFSGDNDNSRHLRLS